MPPVGAVLTQSAGKQSTLLPARAGRLLGIESEESEKVPLYKNAEMLLENFLAEACQQAYYSMAAWLLLPVVV